MLTRQELEKDAWYEVDGRNFSVAQWTGCAFRGCRYKFGHHFWAEELYWHDSEHYGTVKPLRKLKPSEIPDAPCS